MHAGISVTVLPEMVLQAIARHGETAPRHAGCWRLQDQSSLRAAERAALLDNLSDGRLEVGLARSGGREWETFDVSEESSVDDLVELTELLPRAWQDEAFSWNGKHWTLPERTVLPKPVQQPHPPLWHTCSSPPPLTAGQMAWAFPPAVPPVEALAP